MGTIDMQLGIDGWPADREKKMHFVEHHGCEDCRFFLISDDGY